MKKRFSFRRARDEPTPAIPRPPLWVVLFCAAVIIFSRRPDAFLHPQFWAEDGHYWFSLAYNGAFWSHLFAPQDGYLQTISRLTGGLATLVPLRFAPCVFTLVAFVFQLLPVVILASERLAKVIPSYAARLGLAFLYLALPNSFELNMNVTNVQWRLVLIAFLLICAAAPAVRWRRVADYVLVVLSSLSGPFSVLLAPIAIVQYVRTRTRHARNFALLISTSAAIQLVCLVFLTARVNQDHQLGITLARLIKIVGLQLGAAALGGSHLVSSTTLGTHYQWLFALVVFGLIAAALLFGPAELKLFNLLAIGLFAAALAAPALDGSPKWEVLTYRGSGVRYYFFPLLAIVANTVWLATARVRLFRIAGTVLLAMTVFIAVPYDWIYPAYEQTNYTQQVATFDKLPKGQTQVFHENPGSWFYVLKRR